MAMATDTVAAASSVQNEYNVRSKTTENSVALLKANIEALAIQFGKALMPYINQIVAFLTSPEGQEWGARAVEKLVGFVTGLADMLGTVAGIFGTIIDAIGGTGVAVAGLGVAVTALLGPWGLLVAAMVGLISNAGSVVKSVDDMADSLFNLNGVSLSNIAMELFNLGGAAEIAQGKIDAAARAKRGLLDDKAIEDDLDKQSQQRTQTYGYGSAPMAAPRQA